MKNQYVGDVGDYGKYSLLRFLALHGIRIGINWYLTDNDKSSDGKFTEYLNSDAERVYDPDIYDELKAIAEKNPQLQRTVKMIQDAEMIPGAVFFDEKLDSVEEKLLERAWKRHVWFERSAAVLKNTELVFADPDNGISYKKTSRNKGCEKYVLPEEVAMYYYSGKDIVYYCHRGRRTDDKWEQAKSQIKKHVCDACLFALTFHRGTQRSYIFVVHPEQQRKYESLLKEFLSTSKWGEKKMFTWENVREVETGLPPDLCERWAVINYFQKAFPFKTEKETVLERMTNEQIDQLINASTIVQGKNFYNAYKKSGFSAPTIGTIYPEGTIIKQNDDGTISIIQPLNKEKTE